MRPYPLCLIAERGCQHGPFSASAVALLPLDHHRSRAQVGGSLFLIDPEMDRWVRPWDAARYGEDADVFPASFGPHMQMGVSFDQAGSLHHHAPLQSREEAGSIELGWVGAQI